MIQTETVRSFLAVRRFLVQFILSTMWLGLKMLVPCLFHFPRVVHDVTICTGIDDTLKDYASELPFALYPLRHMKQELVMILS